MAKQGLYANIHAKRKRIAAGSGEKMRKAGAKGAPTAKQFKQAAKTAKPSRTTKKRGWLCMTKKDSRLQRAGVSGYNKPKKTPNHPKKSHVVVAKSGDQVKTIRFGQQGVTGDKKPTARQKSFKARHAKNISKGKMSAAYWANKVKW